MKKISIFLLFFVIFFFNSLGSEISAATNITVDFTKVVRPVSPLQFGMVESEYGWPNVLTTDTLQRTRLTKLGLGYMRVALKYKTVGDSTSGIACAASGCPQQIVGDEWVNQVKAIGATPIGEVQYQNSTPSDAAAMVKHFNIDTNNRINIWVIGNEPDLNSITATNYSNFFNQVYDAMKAVDPTIKIGGATTAWFDNTFLQTFLTMSGTRTDFVDFHAYDRQSLTADQDLSSTVSFENHINSLRNMIQATVPTRASKIDIHIGEWNLKSTAITSEETVLNTVWGASVIGHIINAGGYSRQYADKGGLGGALYSTSLNGQNLDDPLPIYHATGMFTGEGLFQHFGTSLVTSSTALNNIEVYSSDNPKNIVVVNKDPSITQSGDFSLSGINSGTVDVWRMDQTSNPSNPPNKIGTIQIQNGSFTFDLLPYSVTTFVISSGVSPTSTPTCSAVSVPDTNGDGKVDGIDYVRVLNHYGQVTSTGPTGGDFNCDGKVDITDLNLITAWIAAH